MPSHLKYPPLGIQHPLGIVCFLVLMALWFAGRLLPEQAWENLRLFSRVSGYIAAGAMLIPFVHILRRFIRHRYLGLSSRWLSWHIGAAYVGFLFLLFHCRARTEGSLTMALLVLVWAVMLSGVIGFYGQKLLYRLLPRLVPREYGLERLEPERRACLEWAYRILAENQITDWKKIPIENGANPGRLAGALAEVAGSQKALKESVDLAWRREPEKSNKWQEWHQSRVLLGRTLHVALARQGLLLTGTGSAVVPVGRRELSWDNRTRVRASYPELLRDVPRAVAEFSDEAIEKCLTRPFTLWRWLRAGKESKRLDENLYKRAREIASLEADRRLVEAIWELVEKRRLLDLEYRLHALGRLWLLFHGPLALAMLVLLIEHIAMSMRFGGF